ncbi:hypothetical protein P691DRAFT_549636 [Macrolepiota fuliginosa MF-IS2]|uniref:Uncharacterized protein n=1 Tax=Macrolepiota fuliginosa MF-IS2 TaxID=1400762 RepID=A0A9P5XF07_9AGAR|nr:hypothetical protein P691DRAFT_549636 [Macrolepiota fuliginosa MF-IS2]
MGTKAYPTNPLPEISGKTRRSRAGKASGYAQRLIDDTPHELDNGDDALAAQSAGQVVVDQSSHAGAFPGSRKPLESNRISVASFKQATKSYAISGSGFGGSNASLLGGIPSLCSERSIHQKIFSFLLTNMATDSGKVPDKHRGRLRWGNAEPSGKGRNKRCGY